MGKTAINFIKDSKIVACRYFDNFETFYHQNLFFFGLIRALYAKDVADIEDYKLRVAKGAATHCGKISSYESDEVKEKYSFYKSKKFLFEVAVSDRVIEKINSRKKIAKINFSFDNPVFDLYLWEIPGMEEAGDLYAARHKEYRDKEGFQLSLAECPFPSRNINISEVNLVIEAMQTHANIFHTSDDKYLIADFR